MTRRRVTFVSHDASLTGAPMLLAELIGWLSREGLAEGRIVCLRGGPLTGRFEKLGPTRVLERTGQRASLTAVSRGLAELGAPGSAARLNRARLRRALAAPNPPELLWLSAAPSLAAIDALDPAAETPIVAHIHELSGLLAELYSPAELRRLLRRCDVIVVGAESVAADVIAAGADPALIHICDEFIPPIGTTVSSSAAAQRRQELGVPGDAALVGAMATASHRKGIDLFVVLARLLANRGGAASEAHFVWVGGHPDDMGLAEARLDAKRAGLADRIHFVGEQTDLDAWFAVFDLFVLTSREDSFPLVCLHAGQHGLAVVAFDSGIGDLLARAGDPQSAIAELDIAAMADRVATMLADPALRAETGARLAAEVQRRHNTDTAAPALWKVMAEVARWA